MNLPNKITIGRILMIPIFMFTFLSDKVPYGQTIGAVIFAIAAFTDGLDGHIARSRNQITTFGKFMDPLADKLLTSAAFISLVEVGKVKAWVVILILAREFFITGFRTLAVSEGITIAASKLGKIKTVTQILAIILLMTDGLFFSFPIDQIMLYLALFFTLVSGFDYIYKNKAVFKNEF